MATRQSTCTSEASVFNYLCIIKDVGVKQNKYSISSIIIREEQECMNI